MNVMHRPDWTVERFLEWEKRQPTRYEFDGKNVIDMNGSTIRHQIICGNLHAALHNHLRTNPGRVLLPTQVRTGSTVRYPDIAITLTAQPGGDRHVVDAVVLFEVISKSSERTDLTHKLLEYTGLPILRRYVVLSPSSKPDFYLLPRGRALERAVSSGRVPRFARDRNFAAVG